MESAAVDGVNFASWEEIATAGEQYLNGVDVNYWKLGEMCAKVAPGDLPKLSARWKRTTVALRQWRQVAVFFPNGEREQFYGPDGQGPLSWSFFLMAGQMANWNEKKRDIALAALGHAADDGLSADAFRKYLSETKQTKPRSINWRKHMSKIAKMLREVSGCDDAESNLRIWAGQSYRELVKRGY